MQAEEQGRNRPESGDGDYFDIGIRVGEKKWDWEEEHDGCCIVGCDMYDVSEQMASIWGSDTDNAELATDMRR